MTHGLERGYARHIWHQVCEMDMGMTTASLRGHSEDKTKVIHYIRFEGWPTVEELNPNTADHRDHHDKIRTSTSDLGNSSIPLINIAINIVVNIANVINLKIFYVR